MIYCGFINIHWHYLGGGDLEKVSVLTVEDKWNCGQ